MCGKREKCKIANCANCAKIHKARENREKFRKAGDRQTMDILDIFFSEAGGEVTFRTDEGLYTMTRADFRTFSKRYLADDFEERWQHEDKRRLFPLYLADDENENEGEAENENENADETESESESVNGHKTRNRYRPRYRRENANADGDGESAAEELRFADEKLRALRYALYLLEISDKSVRSLRGKLKQKGYSERACDAAIAVLLKNERLSDEAFCRRKCELLAEGKKYGRRRIVAELVAKGVDASLCDRILDEADIDFTENLRSLCEKLFREPPHDRDERRKATAKLARYGYSYDEIYAVLEEICDEEEF